MMEHAVTKRPWHRRATVILLIAGLAALLLGMVGMYLKTDRTPDTISDVARSIQAVALERCLDGSTPHGGSIGPWWIAAQATDPLTGALTGFSMTSGDLHLGAERANIWVDPVHDTFSIELQEVVVLAAPDEDEERSLMTMESYILGPALWGREIIADNTLQEQAVTLGGFDSLDQ